MGTYDWILYVDSLSSSFSTRPANQTIGTHHESKERNPHVPLYINLCLSDSTSERSAIACLRSLTVFSGLIVMVNLSSDGPLMFIEISSLDIVVRIGR